MRGFPFSLADIEALRHGALTPIDPRRSIARFVLPELPECLTLTDAPATVHALCHRHRDPLRRNQKGWQYRGGLLAPVA